jgi:putative membrane protein
LISLEVKNTPATRYKIAGIYIILIAGAVWHFLNIFPDLLGHSASLIMALISVWILIECHRYLRLKTREEAGEDSNIRQFYIWTAVVFVLSIGIEIIGVHSGHIFGSYTYGDRLWPAIGGVPLAIGFSWINLLLSSAAILDGVRWVDYSKHPWLAAALAGLLMVLFDLILEPAAGRLGYWSWAEGTIPLQNYIAWWILGFLFARAGIAFSVFARGLPQIIRHAYFAQLAYFILVNLG